MRTAFCFDLDGTVTRDEILPVLSREVGLFEEISALTDATIKGVIPFRKSFLLRCRLLSEIPVEKVQDIIWNIGLYEEVLEFIKSNKDRCFVITGNLDAWVEPLIARFECRFYCSAADVQNGRLTSVADVLNKADAIHEIKQDHDRIVAIGDGMGDVAMFEEADVGIAFGGTHDPIQTLVQLSDYVTYSERGLCNLLSTLS